MFLYLLGGKEVSLYEKAAKLAIRYKKELGRER